MTKSEEEQTLLLLDSGQNNIKSCQINSKLDLESAQNRALQNQPDQNHQSLIKSSYQLLLYSSGVFIFYVIFGYTQEWLFSSDDFKPYGGYATLVQFLQYAAFAQLEHMLTSRSITIPVCKPPYRNV